MAPAYLLGKELIDLFVQVIKSMPFTIIGFSKYNPLSTGYCAGEY